MKNGSKFTKDSSYFQLSHKMLYKNTNQTNSEIFLIAFPNKLKNFPSSLFLLRVDWTGLVERGQEEIDNP